VFTAYGHWYAYDLLTGNLAWTSETLDYPWDEPGFGDYNIISAYGKIFRTAYSGVYAINWADGKIAWKYEQPAEYPFDNPYINANGTTVYSFRSGQLIADGKLYVYNLEHSPEQPIKRGWKLHCINITTGENIWKITASGHSRRFAGAIADGYLSFLNNYDGYQYIFGKGKSATTITAPDMIIQKGQGIVIKGTVLDMSPAQPNTPCVSKDSMTTQMEYLHMQMPIDGLKGNSIITGVPVVLTALDSNGNAIDIGTVTTDGYYGTFNKAWIPPAEGDYKIIASFAGDDSYGSSGAATAISVGAAANEITIPEQITPPDYTMTIIGTGIAVIIAVAIAVLILRKR
jgi:outer membrane protein assembly factor BamB